MNGASFDLHDAIVPSRLENLAIETSRPEDATDDLLVEIESVGDDQWETLKGHPVGDVAHEGKRVAVASSADSVEGQRRDQTSIAAKIHVIRSLPPAKERISSAWSSSTANPVIRLLLKRRHDRAARSSQRATVFQAVPSTRAIADMLTPVDS